MLHLTEISIPRKVVIDRTMKVDPLVASDLDYCVKTWMACEPSVACRPWRASILKDTVRVTGWRARPAGWHVELTGHPGCATYVGSRTVALGTGEPLTLMGRFVPLRRCGKIPRDAAQGQPDAEAAYATWLRERLVDVMPFATMGRIMVEGASKRRILRKVAHDRGMTRVRAEVVTVLEATVSLTVRDPSGVEAWLLRGLGPQKAFGYGAMIPTLGSDVEEVP